VAAGARSSASAADSGAAREGRARRGLRAWTLLSAEGREAFRERLSVGETEWSRGRVWALWKTLAACSGTLGDGDDGAASARRVLAEICSEYKAGSPSGVPSHGELKGHLVEAPSASRMWCPSSRRAAVRP
jgi:hypothetical protein